MNSHDLKNDESPETDPPAKVIGATDGSLAEFHRNAAHGAFGIAFLGSCLLGAIVGCFSACLLNSNMQRGESALFIFGFGLVAATPVSISIYLNFGRQTWWKKWGAVMIAVAGLIVLLSALLMVNIPVIDSGDSIVIVALLLIAPTVVIVAITPVWIARYLFLWRVELPEDQRTPARPSILSLACATGFVAIVLAGLRGAGGLLRVDETMAWFALVPLCIFGLLATIVQFVGLWTWLRFDDLHRAAGIAIAPLAIAPLLAMLFGVTMSDPGIADMLLFLSFLVAGVLTGGYLPMIVLRSYGYRIFAGNPVPKLEPVPESDP